MPSKRYATWICPPAIINGILVSTVFVFHLLNDSEEQLQNLILSAKKRELDRVSYMRDTLFESHFKEKINRAKLEGTFSEEDLSQVELDIFRTDVLRKDSKLSELNEKYYDLLQLVGHFEENRINILKDFPREFYVSKKQKTFAIIAAGLFITFLGDSS